MTDKSGTIQCELQESMGNDQSIALSAWTSTYSKERREDRYDDPQKVEDIVRRCIRDGHTVPIESVVLRFWIRLPVFADRQHMTHRIASHSGLSGRYRTLPDDFMPLPADVLAVLEKTEQINGSGYVRYVADEYQELMSRQRHWYADRLNDLREAEQHRLITNPEYKRAREFLRGVLGTSFMVERTTIFNLHSFANYQRLRNSGHAQPEIREIARRMLGEVLAKRIAPIAIDELTKQGWVMAHPNHDVQTYLAAPPESL